MKGDARVAKHTCVPRRRNAGRDRDTAPRRSTMRKVPGKTQPLNWQVVRAAQCDHYGGGRKEVGEVSRRGRPRRGRNSRLTGGVEKPPEIKVVKFNAHHIQSAFVCEHSSGSLLP